VGQTCSKGHEVREGVAFCTTCGVELAAARSDATEATAPAGAPRGRRRVWVALGALLVIVVAGAGLAWAAGGSGSSSPDDEFIAAVRAAAPDSTATLTDADILDTGQINCEMARNGTLAAEIERAEEAAALIEVPAGEMTERMSLPLTYICPQYVGALSTTTAAQPERATTTAPPSTTTAPPTTTTPAPSGEPGEDVLRANEAFGVQFGTAGDEAIATITEQVGAPLDRQPIEGPGLDGEYIKFPTEISIVIGRAPGDTGPLRLIRWDTTGTWRTDKNIGVGSAATEVYAAYPNVQGTTGCYDDDPPSLTASNPPTAPDPIEFVLDPTGTTVTAMAAPAYNIVGC
jgi:hypothetical protein